MRDHFGFDQSIDFDIDRPLGTFIDRLEPKGIYPLVEHIRDGKVIGTYRIENGITDGGKNYALNVAFGGGTQVAAADWAIGLISSTGYTALNPTDTMASHPTWTEFTGYSNATRPAWGPGTSTSKIISNGTAAVFIVDAAGMLRGIFVVSSNTKGGATGILWAHGLFPSEVPAAPGDQIRITYAVAC